MTASKIRVHAWRIFKNTLLAVYFRTMVFLAFNFESKGKKHVRI